MHDLIVYKDITDNSQRPFYVNSNNKANDNKYYPAYMYVENCKVNSTNASYVADATGRGKSYFYYNNLTYGNGTYSNNTSYIKNVVMEWNDWEW